MYGSFNSKEVKSWNMASATTANSGALHHGVQQVALCPGAKALLTMISHATVSDGDNVQNSCYVEKDLPHTE